MKNKKVCEFFIKGHCRKGVTCNFLHVNIVQEPELNTNQSYGTKSTICKFYQQGYCKNGMNCRNIHDQSQRIQRSQNQDQQQYQNPFKKQQNQNDQVNSSIHLNQREERSAQLFNQIPQQQQQQQYQQINVNKNAQQLNQQQSQRTSHNQHRGSKEKQYFSYKYLTELKDKEDNQILQELYQIKDLKEVIDNSEFKYDKKSYTNDCLELLTLILLKISQGNSDEVKDVLNRFIQSEFFNKIGEYLEFFRQYFVNILQKNKERIHQYFQFMTKLCQLFKVCADSFRTLICKLPLETFEKTLKEIGDIIDYEIDLKPNFIKLNELFQEIQSQCKTSRQKDIAFIYQRQKPQLNTAQITYKNDTIIITANDIQALTNPIIESHRTKGSYESWERYFNTLFYLVKEDCYRMLKKSIISISNSGVSRQIEKQHQDIYIYKEGRITNVDVNGDGLLFTLIAKTLNEKPISKKKLMYGSLLVLTDYDFKMYAFAIVSEGPHSKAKNITKKDKDKKNKENEKNHQFEFKVNLVENTVDHYEDMMNLFDQEVFIFESKAFFESFRYTLKRLQNQDIYNLPFRNIIIDYQPNNYQKIPDYILQNSMFTFQNQRFYSIQQPNTWPQCLQQNLDLSQQKALHHALNNRLAIIQGPPGTGKTYLGGMLTKILLDYNKNLKILIICKTNHALDQFLKHIIKFEQNIVRVGSRSLEAELDQYKITNLRKEARQLNRDLTIKLTLTYREIEELKSKMNLNKYKKTSVLDYNDFSQEYTDILQMIINDFYVFLNVEIKEIQYKDLYNAWCGVVKYDRLVDKILENNKNYSSNEEYWILQEDLQNVVNKIMEFDEQTNLVYNQQKQQKEERRQNQNQQLEEDDNLSQEESDDENLNRMDLINDMFQQNQEQKQQQQQDQIIDDLDFISTDKATLEREYQRLSQLQNIWQIGKRIRQRQAIYMKEKYLKKIQANKSEEIEKLNLLVNRKRGLETLLDIDVIKNARIVGMTTNGCAKFSSLIEQVKFQIVIIEEAAEVIESDIAAILTKYNQHLIMIGDHHQLRPKVYCHELVTQHHFDVSLFERLINNGFPQVILSNQRRMRPEFADFVRLIYPEGYRDHETVKNQPDLKGFQSNIFFIDHNQIEQGADQGSKTNMYEAKFIAKLARYCTQQEYGLQDITIITMYIGQVMLIRSQLKNLGLEAIKVTAVDNYQGEENKIILLSLVRSNSQNKIGFVKTFNRICVAISRAQLGFYLIGNFKCLIEGQKKYREYDNDPSKQNLWAKIYELAKQKKVIDTKFEFKCNKHQLITVVQCAEDFDKMPEGKCNQLCKERLICGHVCEFYCHNFPHDPTQCQKKCQKILDCGHPCKKICGQKCGNCMALVEKQLQCGHLQEDYCYKKINEIRCKNPCQKRNNCGHLCQNKCSDPCSEECSVKVQKVLICGHKQESPCFQQIYLEKCNKKCDAELQCGHKCTGNCHSCLKGTLHKPCTKKCDKNLMCSHICKQECSLPCLCNEKCTNECVHGNCAQKCYFLCSPCQEKCSNQCEHVKCNKLCHEQCGLRPCNQRCKKQLKCKHRCLGLCGENCPDVCKECDNELNSVQKIFGTEDEDDALFYELECKHIFEVFSLDKWFQTRNQEINVKKCPTCKKAITKSKRYSDYIKQQFKDIWEIKAKMLQQLGRNYQNYYKEIQDSIHQQAQLTQDSKLIQKLFLKIKEIDKDSYPMLLTAKYYCQFAPKIADIDKFYQTIQPSLDPLHAIFYQNYQALLLHFSSIKLYCQEFYNEMDKKIENLWIFTHPMCQQFIKEQGTASQRLIQQFNITFFNLSYDDMDELIRKRMQMERKREIKEIMSIVEGRWYRCPNGHLYAVWNCGMPMEMSVCPDCGARIGGQNHQSVQGVQQFDGNI